MIFVFILIFTSSISSDFIFVISTFLSKEMSSLLTVALLKEFIELDAELSRFILFSLRFSFSIIGELLHSPINSLIEFFFA